MDLQATTYNLYSDIRYLEFQVHEQNFDCEIPQERLFVEFVDPRPLEIKIRDSLLAVFRQLASFYHTFIKVIQSYLEEGPPNIVPLNPTTGKYDSERLPWFNSYDSDGLFVFIHGLRSTPLCWKNYLIALKDMSPGAHCFAPYVYERGNCPLNDAGSPILTAIKDYAAHFPGKTIHLIGTSNGGRIAGWLERHLTLEEKTQLDIVSIAGIHFGSRLLDYFPQFMLNIALHEEIQKDFAYGGDAAVQQLNAWRQHAANSNHLNNRYFYATSEDRRVFDIASALPRIGRGDRKYILIHGHSHDSIVEGVRDMVLKGL